MDGFEKYLYERSSSPGPHSTYLFAIRSTLTPFENFQIHSHICIKGVNSLEENSWVGMVIGLRVRK